MKNKDLSILVVGAGAVGGITAVLLKKDGYDVEIVCKYDDYARLISSRGIEVNGACDNFIVPMLAHASLAEIEDKKDIILHATKANDMIEAAKSMKNILKENGFVISMQNGMCADDLAAILGKDKVIGCVTGWGATMNSQGSLVMTSAGDFIIGYPEKAPDEYLLSIAEILSSVVPVKMTDNIIGHLYSKLIINSCITSLGAICGMYLGKMLSIKKIRRIFIEIIREAVAVADKMQIKIEVFAGKLDFHKFLNGKSLFADFRRHLFLIILGFKYRKLKSSSLQSLERGKLTEIDYLNGYIVKNGKRLGIPVPVNTAVVDMIHDIEQKKREITFNNFDNLVFERFNN